MKKVLMVALGATMCLPMMAEKLSDVDSLKMYELQELQVRSLRATKNTPVAYTDMGKVELQSVNHGQDVPYILSLTPSITTTSDAGNGIGYTTHQHHC